MNQQRLFGAQRTLKTVEDFTEFEQRGAYFDGDTVIAVKKGVNILDRGHQVQAMAELQEIVDFPPAPKLDGFMRLDRTKATASELRGEQLFYGKARCAECHPPPIFSDNFSHQLTTERFYTPTLVNGLYEIEGGPTKTFPLRGIKDSPTYLHDGRLIMLDDAIEFFNLVLGTQLSENEKRDLLDRHVATDLDPPARAPRGPRSAWHDRGMDKAALRRELIASLEVALATARAAHAAAVGSTTRSSCGCRRSCACS